MANYHVRGFPIDSYSVGESEVKLTLYTLERGKIEIAVRGVKKLNSSLRPALHPMNEGHFFIAERRAADLLTEWESLDTYGKLESDPKKVAIIGYAAHFILSLISLGEPDYSLYVSIKNIYFLLQSNCCHDIIKTLFEWAFLRIAGLAPELGTCAARGGTLESGAAWWDIAEGTLFCGDCAERNSTNVIMISERAMEYARAVERAAIEIGSRPLEAEEEGGVVADAESYGPRERERFGRALLRFCQYHLNEDVPGWLVKV